MRLASKFGNAGLRSMSSMVGNGVLTNTSRRISGCFKSRSLEQGRHSLKGLSGDWPFAQSPPKQRVSKVAEDRLGSTVLVPATSAPRRLPG